MKEKIISLNKNDFDVQAIRGSGPGGQHRNKTSTGIRITHKESGAWATATDNKSQKVNKRNAFLRLVETKEFKKWLNREVNIKMGVLDEVEKAMDPVNIKCEVQDNGLWVPWNLTGEIDDET